MLATGSLAGGTTAGFLGVTKGLTKAASAGLGALSFDADYNRHRLLTMQKQAGSTSQGLRMGTSLLTTGVSSGVSGLVSEPLRGARETGSTGFVLGVGRGFVGFLTKPVAGISAFAAKTAEGVTSDVKRYTPNSKAEEQVMRVRQPRELGALSEGAGSVLLPYPPRLQMEDARQRELGKPEYGQQ